jgi:hypothetical protein
LVRARSLTSTCATSLIFRDRRRGKWHYFRSSRGALFQVATEKPGFVIDEPVDELGWNLRLPTQELLRADLKRTLPPLVRDGAAPARMAVAHPEERGRRWP